jgi:hypothetical protein
MFRNKPSGSSELLRLRFQREGTDLTGTQSPPYPANDLNIGLWFHPFQPVLVQNHETKCTTIFVSLSPEEKYSSLLRVQMNKTLDTVPKQVSKSHQ